MESKSMSRFAAVSVGVLFFTSFPFPAYAQPLPKQADKIMADTIKDLNREVEKAMKLNKQADATSLLQLVKDLETEVLKRKSGDDWLKWRRVMLSQRIVGRWSRVGHPDTYELQPPPNKCKAIGPNGATLGQGDLAGFTGDDTIVCKWASGHVWHLTFANDRVVAVKEIFGRGF